MAFRRGMISTTIALGIALTLSVPLPAVAQGRGQGGGQEAGAQAQGRGQGGAQAPGAQAPGGQAQGRGQGGRGGGAQQYTPAAGAKDLKAVLFNWTWYMGMLRSTEERDLIASLEYQGKGTVQVDGQPCTATKYRISNNYQTSGERIQYTCTRPNGQTYSNVEVLSGAYAWNEDIPGAELVAGKGKATPMPAAVQERMIRLWASPQGAPKAALAGIADPPQMAPKKQRPSRQFSFAATRPRKTPAMGKAASRWPAGAHPSQVFLIPIR